MRVALSPGGLRRLINLHRTPFSSALYNRDIMLQGKVINAVIFVLLCIVSLVTNEQLIAIHERHIDLLANVAHGVIERQPAWIAYQNRLLGPAAVLLISKVGITFTHALKIFYVVMIIVENFLLYYLLKKSGSSRVTSLAWVIAYSLLFVLFQDVNWYYTWDSFDAIIFTLFAYLVLWNKSFPLLVCLFFVALLNRESALFIALFFVIDSIDFIATEISAKKIIIRLESTRKFVIGCMLFFLGAAYTKIIRSYLFISLPGGLNDAGHQTLGNHIYWGKNMYDLFFGNLGSGAIPNSFFVIGSLLFVGYIYKICNTSQKKAIVIYGVIVFNILIFGVMNETRMLIILFPILIFLIASIASSPKLFSRNN